jgi:hypothetical protein
MTKICDYLIPEYLYSGGSPNPTYLIYMYNVLIIICANEFEKMHKEKKKT